MKSVTYVHPHIGGVNWNGVGRPAFFQASNAICRRLPKPTWPPLKRLHYATDFTKHNLATRLVPVLKKIYTFYTCYPAAHPTRFDFTGFRLTPIWMLARRLALRLALLHTPKKPISCLGRGRSSLSSIRRSPERRVWEGSWNRSKPGERPVSMLLTAHSRATLTWGIFGVSTFARVRAADGTRGARFTRWDGVRRKGRKRRKVEHILSRSLQGDFSMCWVGNCHFLIKFG